MVYKLLTGGIGGDLNTLADGFGAGNDLIVVAYEVTAPAYEIYTLGGADFIDLRDTVFNDATGIEVFSGAGRDTVQGGAGEEYIYDQSGNDLFILRGSDDEYSSGAGNDTANGGAGWDEISFERFFDDAGGSIINTEGNTCDLAKTGAQNFGVFGRDHISGFEGVKGGGGADRLFGTGGANEISGGGGADLLNGRGGADRIIGDQGNDRLIGGGGADVLSDGTGIDSLTGGGGADHIFGSEDSDRLTGGGGADLSLLDDGLSAARDFVIFTRIGDSGTGLSSLSIDVILDFDQGGLATDDKIDLSAIDANRSLAGNQAFVFRGLGDFRAPFGEVRIIEGGGNTLVMVDIDGDGASEMNIRVDGVVGLTAGDFLL
jgi:serralysin